jgi:hypothetical protein
MSSHDGAGHCETCGRVVLTDGTHIASGSTSCAGNPL